jgi:hypothetical protein
MTDFAIGFLARSAVMLPIILLMSGGAWLAAKKLGYLLLDQPFNASDMRTWPLSYVAIEATVFGLVFAALAVAFGDSEFSTAIAAGTAALAATGGVPAIASLLRK